MVAIMSRLPMEYALDLLAPMEKKQGQATQSK
jgi:hypothetical protein